MALSSSSTLQQIVDQVDDNLDYDLSNNVTKVKDVIYGLRLLLRKSSEEIEKGSERVKNLYRGADSLLESAETWWKANDPNAATSTGGKITNLDLQDFRE